MEAKLELLKPGDTVLVTGKPKDPKVPLSWLAQMQDSVGKRFKVWAVQRHCGTCIARLELDKDTQLWFDYASLEKVEPEVGPFKEGDVVRVWRKVERDPHNDEPVWVEDMDRTVGEVGHVRLALSDYPGRAEIDLLDGETCWYLVTALEEVEI